MRIYFLGVAGTAMGNAALLLRDQGHEVFGSDQAIYPPMSDLLREAGVSIMEGYSAERLAGLGVDLVVVGNAFSRGNEEVEFLLESRSIPFCSLPEALGRFALSGGNNIVVTGTHGKTTTTAMVAHLLIGAGVEPGYLIGGAPIDPPSGWANAGEGAPFVIEGDEYDSAFFDKRSKFIHYRPRIVVVNNLEFDHADIFRDLEDVKRTFSHLLRIVPRNGFVLINGDDANACSLLPIPWTQVVKVGVDSANDLRIVNFETLPDGSSFELYWKGERWLSVRWGLSGMFNARNAAMAYLAAALAAVYAEASPVTAKLGSLESFRGVKRRQQERAQVGNIRIIEDFAHHPTAIEEMLRAYRERFDGARIVAAFEPRSNTSRLEIMRERMGKALSLADEVVVGPAKESSSPDVEIVDTAAMAMDLKGLGVEAIASASNDEAFDRLGRVVDSAESRETVVVFLTNGSFGGIIGRLVDYLNAREG